MSNTATTLTLLLKQYSELFDVDMSNYHVYGSPMRPMSNVWARIPGAVFMQSNKQQTGYHTYVAVPEPLEKTDQSRFELVEIKHPTKETQA